MVLDNPLEWLKVKRSIQQIAVAITGDSPQFVLAYYNPGSGVYGMAFENVARQVRQQGGRIRYGWTAHLHAVPRLEQGDYLCMVHHAVWESPEGVFVDVTPIYELSPPLKQADQLLFLMDDKAEPQTALALGLPSQFYSLHDHPSLNAYVSQLNQEEQLICERTYVQAASGLIRLQTDTVVP